MVFTKLSAQEKDAFFNLLDEYFQSRPELLGQRGSSQGVGGTGISTAAAASVVQRALAANVTGGTGGAAGKSNNPYMAALTTARSSASGADVAQAAKLGRVAAASLVFSQGAGGGEPTNPSTDVLPSLPRRVAPNVPMPAHTRAEQTPGSEVDKLTTGKASMFSALKKQQTPVVAIPSAFVVPKNEFGPPPVRRATSETSGGGTSTAGTTPRPGGAPRAVPRQPEPEAQSEQAFAEGEWAEALYDYTSEDPGDLTIEVGARVFVIAKSSEDWWTGQVEGQGKEGLFPASYVRLL